MHLGDLLVGAVFGGFFTAIFKIAFDFCVEDRATKLAEKMQAEREMVERLK